MIGSSPVFPRGKTSTVGYHVRGLHKLGAIRLVRTRQRRGATEHFYTTAVRITITQEAIEDGSR